MSNFPPCKRALGPDWDQRRFELLKSAMPGIISLLNNENLVSAALKFGNKETSISSIIAATSIGIVDEIINQLKNSEK